MNRVLLRAFTLMALTVVFATPFQNRVQAQCSLDTEWTFDPPIPASGSYSAGETIEICGEITFYQSNGANW
ncbi:MAG TPA: hypothetical protein VJ911_09315, partial [Cryomorphaceae bacterium]|nr:hypothetical protein [Cryomorphaceae bacterium]